MPFTLTMPKLSPTMDEGTIAKWLKKEGDFVEAGDVLMEVSTDKATVEHAALDSGYLRQILIKDGQSAIVNQPIAIFTEEKNESISDYKPEGVEPAKKAPAETVKEEKKPAEQPAATTRATSLQQPAFVPEAPLTEYTFEYPSESIGSRILASPLAKKLAKEKGVDLSTLKGSGPNERIMSHDLEKAQPTGDFAFGHREKPKNMPGSFTEESLSPMRKVIAQRLQEAKSFIPHFYVQKTINAQALVDFREQLRNLNLKVSLNDCVVRACALTLKKHPVVNSGFNSVNNTIVHFNTIDISVAVSVNGGLITPIIRHADFKNLGEISLEVRSLAQRAKEGKLEAQEYKGGSFTVSNLGMYGVTNFQAIINPPQAAILAISGVANVPVVKNGAVVPGKTMNLTLSADHRVIDGVAAAEFMATLQIYLENPVSLLI